MFQTSWVQIPTPYTGWTFFTYICCQYCNDVCLKRQKNKNRGWGCPIFNKYSGVLGSRSYIKLSIHKKYSDFAILRFCPSRFFWVEDQKSKQLISWRSWVWIPATYTVWTFFTYICCKNCNVCLKIQKLTKKRPGMAHFIKKWLSLFRSGRIGTDVERRW